jgi:hypothetical protein
MKSLCVKLEVMFAVIGLSIFGYAEVWGADWTAIWDEGFGPKCMKLSERSDGFFKTPADVMETYQKTKVPYKVADDKVENGKVVQVTIIDLRDNQALTFYYGLERCGKGLTAIKDKQKRELKKYR